jgi:hypothetical protein
MPFIKRFMALGHQPTLCWILFEQGSMVERGSVECSTPFFKALAQSRCLVHYDDGTFMTDNRPNQPMAAFLKYHKQYKRLWKDISKCNLRSIYIQRLIDDDLYQPLPLNELVREIEIADKNVLNNDKKETDIVRENIDTFGDAILAGKCFSWLASRYEDRLLVHARSVKKASTMMMEDGDDGDDDDDEDRRPYTVSTALLNHLGVGFTNPRRTEFHWDTILDEEKDSSTATIPSLPDLKYVVVDVETHDWKDHKKFTLMTRNNSIGKIVEIAWIAYDAHGNELDRKTYLLRPYDGYDRIAEKATRVHGITTRCARERGSDAPQVFARLTRLLRRLPVDGCVIAHNMNHEDAILGTSLPPEHLAVWDSVRKCCTWNPDLLPFLSLPKKSYGMKLSDLHSKVNPTGIHMQKQAHAALIDSQMAWVVYKHYKAVLEQKGLDDVEYMKWLPKDGE